MEDAKDLNIAYNLSGNTVSADTFVDFLREENTDSMVLGADICSECMITSSNPLVLGAVITKVGDSLDCLRDGLCVGDADLPYYGFDIYVEDAETGDPLSQAKVVTTAGESGYTNVLGHFSWSTQAYQQVGITVSKTGYVTYSTMALGSEEGDATTSVPLDRDYGGGGGTRYCTAAVYINTPIKGQGKPSTTPYNISKDTAVLLTNYTGLTQYFGGTMLTYQGQSYTAIFLNSEGKYYRNVPTGQATSGCFTVPASQKVILMADGHSGQTLSTFKFTIQVSTAGYPAPVYSAGTTTTVVLSQLTIPVYIGEDGMWGARLTATCNGSTKRVSMGGSYDDDVFPQAIVHCSGTSVNLTIDRMGRKSASVTATRNQYGAFNSVYFTGNTFTKTSDWDRLATPPLISSGTGWMDYAELANEGLRCETFNSILPMPHGGEDFKSYPTSLGRVTNGSRCLTIGEFVPNFEDTSVFMSGDNYQDLYF